MLRAGLAKARKGSSRWWLIPVPERIGAFAGSWKYAPCMEPEQQLA
jgi:hypothetical protein